MCSQAFPWAFESGEQYELSYQNHKRQIAKHELRGLWLNIKIRWEKSFIFKYLSSFSLKKITVKFTSLLSTTVWLSLY